MKVCLIDMDFTNFGGVEHVTAALANAFADSFETHILSCCSDGDANGKPAYELRKEVKYHNLGLKRGRLREMLKSFKLPIRNYINENEIDVVLFQGHWIGFFGSAACRKTKAKTVFCDHGSLKNQWSEKDAVFMRITAAVRCDRLVTLTKRNADDFCKLLPIRKKTCCIYNWVDTDVYKYGGYDRNSKKIVSAGRFTKEKGFDMLMKVMQRVVEKQPDCVLDLYGDGVQREQLEKLAVEYKIEKNVNFMGMHDGLSELYRNYAMYVMPSYREGLPLVLLEAKSCGLPIVSFDIMTGPRDIVDDGCDGILIPPYDIDLMADSICGLLIDKERRVKMSEHTQTGIGRFSKERILSEWVELLNGLAR